MLKKFFTLNFLDAFIAGMTVVLVPLLMQSRGIGIEAIGLIFALAPLIKMAVRLAGASIADFSGDRVIYAANAGSNLLQSLCYIFASSPLWFAAGKLFDGARESLIFSVNRASLMAAAPERKHFVLAGLQSGRFIYNAIGGLAVGWLFLVGGFDLPLVLMAILSAYMLLYTFSLRNIHHEGNRPKLSDFSPFGRKGRFYEAASALALGGAFYMPLVYVLLPLYFGSRGFSLTEIAFFYSAYFLLNGICLNLFSQRGISSRTCAIGGAALFAALLPAIYFSPNSTAPIFFVLLAVGDAFLAVLWEEVNYIGVAGGSKRATDLALINLPAGLMILVVTGVSGFVVLVAGYLPFFAALALTEIAFAAWSLRLSNMKQ